MERARSRLDRRSPRLAGYNYFQAGLYFVTICTHDPASMLGEVRDGEMHPNAAGIATELAWNALPDRFPGGGFDAFVVMPDHMHGIVVLGYDPGPPLQVTIPSLAAVLRTFKSVSGIEGNRVLGRAGQPFWQRRYFDRIIRNERELALIRQYIDDNAARWMETEEPDGS